ncbi:site-specific integrase [Leisingera sp. HS039]|uniref:tyrosine-type recombinase/integrase n=1 Tax=Leisingera sp. HS039 TaxID=2818496 RepID=UPI001B3A50CF|nr:site-specific integrase [Leisingera sp. HS039]MBQ4824399.1 site-specific integrase [Leisingera sp. HS039]
MPLKLRQKTPGGNWHIRGTVAGIYVERSTGTSNRKQAEAIRIRKEAEILQRAALGKKATATFEEAAVNYLMADGEGRFLPPLLLHFAGKKLSEIDNAAINAAAQQLYPKAAPSTINRQLISPISAIMNMAAEDKLCDPIKLRRRKVDTKVTRWLTPEEFEAFAAELPPHLARIIGFMVGSGARVRETLTLQASTFYQGTRQAYLVDTKNGHPRMVEFPERARQMICAADLPETGELFLTSRGKPYELRDNTGGQIKTTFNKARDRAGLESKGPRKVTPHTIRHTWATWFYSQTKDFGKLLDLGGWADADTANIYRKIAPDDLPERLLQHGWDFRRGMQPNTSTLCAVR